MRRALQGIPRWCNGNTPVFGAVIPGSSPGRGTFSFRILGNFSQGFFYLWTWRSELFAVGEGVNLRLQSNDRGLQRVHCAEQLG